MYLVLFTLLFHVLFIPIFLCSNSSFTRWCLNYTEIRIRTLAFVYKEKTITCLRYAPLSAVFAILLALPWSYTKSVFGSADSMEKWNICILWADDCWNHNLKCSSNWTNESLHYIGFSENEIYKSRLNFIEQHILARNETQSKWILILEILVIDFTQFFRLIHSKVFVLIDFL